MENASLTAVDDAWKALPALRSGRASSCGPSPCPVTTFLPSAAAASTAPRCGGRSRQPRAGRCVDAPAPAAGADPPCAARPARARDAQHAKGACRRPHGETPSHPATHTRHLQPLRHYRSTDTGGCGWRERGRSSYELTEISLGVLHFGDPIISTRTRMCVSMGGAPVLPSPSCSREAPRPFPFPRPAPLGASASRSARTPGWVRRAPPPVDTPCTQRLRHGDPIHARKGLTAAAVAAAAAVWPICAPAAASPPSGRHRGLVPPPRHPLTLAQFLRPDTTRQQ
jgi:hypothetical protein